MTPKPPSEHARLALERYRSAAAPPADVKARLEQVLEQRVLRGDLPRFEVEPLLLSVPASSLAERVWSTSWGKASLALLAAAASGAVLYQTRAPEPRPVLGTPTVNVVPAPATPRELAPPPSAPAAAPEPAALAPAPSPPRVRPTPTAAASAAEPTIDEEVRLLNAAQAALRAGDAKRALAISNEHAQRFPTGKLSSARQVTRLMALCQTGAAKQARDEAAAFLAQNPSSPFAERVARICQPPK